MAVIGAGIVGLAVARALGSDPRLRMIVVDKEHAVATHQTGRNSGVVHSGLYYTPGSLKARLCREGRRDLLAYCRDRGIPYVACGKVVVALSTEEIPALRELHRRGVENGVEGLEQIGPAQLRELEPHVAGVAALRVPNASIVDFRAVAGALAEELRSGGTEIVLNAAVFTAQPVAERVRLETSQGPIEASVVVNCAGLHADELAGKLGARPTVRIVPFRGEYKKLTPSARDLVKGLVYPIPDPNLPFLGAHFTPTIQGEVSVGPNAVLALSREGYTRRTVDRRELMSMVRWSGFRRMVRQNWRSGVGEYVRSFHERSFLRALQRLVPELRAHDLLPASAGVRAQAVAEDGTLIDDFRVIQTERAIHVLNAPSPAATASLAIGRLVADLVRDIVHSPGK